ncbi:unnamed protein product, partial [Ectocarpus sp. 8 AP-2014]
GCQRGARSRDPLSAGVHVMPSLGAAAETMAETPLPHGGNQEEELEEYTTSAGNNCQYGWYMMGTAVFLSLVATVALSGSLGETPPIAATTLEESQRRKAWDEGATTGGGYRRRRRRRRSLSGEASGQGVPT